MAAATFFTFSFFRAFMCSAPFDVLGLDARAFGLGVDHDQQHDLVSYQVEVDDTRTAALTRSFALPTHLARTFGTRDHVSDSGLSAMKSMNASRS
jgi:hypothetical protein